VEVAVHGDPTKRECWVKVKVTRMNPSHTTKKIGKTFEVMTRGSASVPPELEKVKGAFTYEEWARRRG
jgi:hypothetical protein